MNEEKKVFLGTVVWFNNKKNFGFIEYDVNGIKQKDIFVHFTGIDATGFKTLLKGQKVSFSISKNKRGEPIAVGVKVVK